MSWHHPLGSKNMSDPTLFIQRTYELLQDMPRWVFMVPAHVNAVGRLAARMLVHVYGTVLLLAAGSIVCAAGA